MYKKVLLLTMLLSLLLVSCEKEDEYEYPSVRTELACAYTADNGCIYKIVLDDGTTYPVSLQDTRYVRNTALRCKVVFSDEIDKIDVYSLKLVRVGQIFPSSAFEIKPMEPLEFISAWRSDDFLNLNVGFMTSSDTDDHEMAFSFDSIRYSGNSKIACMSLLHVRPAHDREAYMEPTFLSMYLEGFQDYDSIQVNINTYDGMIKIVR